MSIPPLPFVSYDDSRDRPNVVVDGSPNAATVLTLSHWPGTPAPTGCAADTSTQMVFRYLEHVADRRGADPHHLDRDPVDRDPADRDPADRDPADRDPADRDPVDRGPVDRDAADGDNASWQRTVRPVADRSAAPEVVTNNHFDQDGLAGIYALVDPDAARRHRPLLEDIAAAGDFGVFHDRRAARLSMAVDALADPRRYPLDLAAGEDRTAAQYRAALELLPAWLDDPDRCRSLWADEDADLEAGLRAVAAGEVGIDEVGELDLAIVTLPAAGRSSGHRFTSRRFTGVHPMALHRATERTAVLMLDPHGGRHHLTDRYEGWVQLHSRAVRPRRDLRPLAELLTEREPGSTRWQAAAPDDLSPTLSIRESSYPSTLAPDALVVAVCEHLRHHPPAWDPSSGRLLAADSASG